MLTPDQVQAALEAEQERLDYRWKAAINALDALDTFRKALPNPDQQALPNQREVGAALEAMESALKQAEKEAYDAWYELTLPSKQLEFMIRFKIKLANERKPAALAAR